MRRAVLVGVAAALITALLVAAATYFEMRCTQLGLFMHDTSVEMRNDQLSRAYVARYGDPLDFLARWMRLNQMVIDPALSFAVGVFVGFLSHRVLISGTLGVAPIVAINWLPDIPGVFSIALCLGMCWSAAAGTRYVLERRTRPSPLSA